MFAMIAFSRLPPPVFLLLASLTCTQEGTYDGETKGGVREGRGRLVWSNGDTYLGDFHNGLRHGQGATISAAVYFYSIPAVHRWYPR